MSDIESTEILVQRLRAEGFAEVQFDSNWQWVARGTKHRDFGALAARQRLIYAGRKAGIPVFTKSFRERWGGKADMTGGVMVAAPQDTAEEAFADYAEGFYG